MLSIIKKIFLTPHIYFITIIWVILAIGFHSWVWTYLDLEWTPIFPSQSKYLADLNFLAFHNSSAYGVDSLQAVWPKILHIFGIAYLWQFLFYWLFFSVTYLSTYFLLRCFLDIRSAFFGALFFAVNPVSVFFMQENAFIFWYTGLSMIVLGIFLFYKYNHIFLGIFFLALWYNFSFTYPRIAIIHTLILIILWVLYWKKFTVSYLFQRKTIHIFIVIFLTLLPTLYGYLSLYIHGETQYFQGMLNYLDTTIDTVWHEIYTNIKNEWFTRYLFPRELFSNFAHGFWDKPWIHIFEQFFYSILVFWGFYHLFFLKNKKREIITVTLVFILFAIFLRKSAIFVDEHTFQILTYKVFPFLANTIDWHLLILIPFLGLYIGLILQHIKNIYLFSFFGFLICIYAGLSFIPFIDRSNVKMQKIEKSSVPSDYKDYFFSGAINQQSTVFLPTQKLWQTLYFPWAPVPVNLFNNTRFRVAFSDNIRINWPIQSQLYANLVANIDTAYMNYQIFNIKNIILFKDVKNLNWQKFDWFEDKDYQSNIKYLSQKLSKSKNLAIQKVSNNFEHFVPKNNWEYDFFLYNPSIFQWTSVDALTKSGVVDLKSTPLLVNTGAFQIPLSQVISFSGAKTNFFYKKSTINPTKIYLKISRESINKPFLLQLNQAFWLTWKIKWVDHDYFDSKNCITSIKSFPLTHNASCEYDSNLIEINNTMLLQKDEVPALQHFEWNFIGNAWIIRPEDIPENMRWQKELYAVIIYEKQIWYSYTLLLSGLTFLILLVATVVQETKYYLSKRKAHD